MVFFQTSFKTTFRPSSSDEWSASRTPATDPTPEWKKKLMQATEAINQELSSTGGESVLQMLNDGRIFSAVGHNKTLTVFKSCRV